MSLLTLPPNTPATPPLPTLLHNSLSPAPLSDAPPPPAAVLGPGSRSLRCNFFQSPRLPESAGALYPTRLRAKP
eukprot:2466917-Rhodomonas_salina.3